MRSASGPPGQSARFGQLPATPNGKTAGFGASGSSPVQPFCSGILKLNAGKDSAASCLGGGAGFSLKWVLQLYTQNQSKTPAPNVYRQSIQEPIFSVSNAGSEGGDDGRGCGGESNQAKPPDFRFGTGQNPGLRSLAS